MIFRLRAFFRLKYTQSNQIIDSNFGIKQIKQILWEGPQKKVWQLTDDATLTAVTIHHTLIWAGLFTEAWAVESQRLEKCQRRSTALPESMWGTATNSWHCSQGSTLSYSKTTSNKFYALCSPSLQGKRVYAFDGTPERSSWEQLLR